MSLKSYTETPKSGTGTAGSSASTITSLASLSEDGTNGIVMIQVPSTEAAGIEVQAGSTGSGILVANDGASVSFPCDDLSKIYVKRQGGADITFRFFAF